MSLTIVNFIVSTNEDWQDSLLIQSGDPLEAVDLTGSTFKAHLRAPIEALSPEIELSTANERLFFDPDQADPDLKGLLSFNVPHAVMRYVAIGTYSMDIVWTNVDGVVDRIVNGTVQVQRGVTRP